MKQLNKPSDNMGGLLAIWVVPPTDIVISINSVNFLSTENIVEFYCSPGSLLFTEKELFTNSGKIYKTELTAFIPKDSLQVLQLINDMSGRKWVIVYMDQNEQYKAAGNESNPLRVKFDLSSGSDTHERNGHIVTFYGTQISKARFIDTSLPPAPPWEG